MEQFFGKKKKKGELHEDKKSDAPSIRQHDTPIVT